MAILIDTHALLWWLRDERRLPARARRLIDEERQRGGAFVSALTALEVSGAARGAFAAVLPGLPEALDANGFRTLVFTFEDAIRAGELPRIHRDPIDRALAAQADRRNLTLVTADARLAEYPIAVFRL